MHKAKQLDTSSEEKLEHLILITVRHAAYNIMRKGNPEPIEDSILNSIPDTTPSPHEIVESRKLSRKIKNSEKKKKKKKKKQKKKTKRDRSVYYSITVWSRIYQHTNSSIT